MSKTSKENGHQLPKQSSKLSKENEEDYEAAAQQRAEEERKNIVQKYAERSKDDDSWVMDAKAKIYRVTDRYGFLHESEPEALTVAEERRKHIEVKRQDKWGKMVKRWDKYVGTEKLRNRVYKGIPLGTRGDAWKLLLDVDKSMQKNIQVYENTKRIAMQISPDIRQIDVDVHRTYRDHIMFRERYSVKQQQLFHVLVAYSMYNTEVGYCQGMSEIAALLLMFMSEEEAFWALHSLLYCNKHSMHGFFIPGFPKLLRFQDHHDKILTKFMPRLKKHLDKNEIYASLYTMKWFFQCFLDRSPFPLTLRLWDIYVLEGEKLLTAMSYTTLKLHKAAIKKMDMEGIVRFLQEKLAQDFIYDHDTTVDHLKVCMNELKKTGMDRPPPAKDDEKPKKNFGTCLTLPVPSPSHSSPIKTSPSHDKNDDSRVTAESSPAPPAKVDVEDEDTTSASRSLSHGDAQGSSDTSIPVAAAEQQTPHHRRDSKEISPIKKRHQQPRQNSITPRKNSDHHQQQHHPHTSNNNTDQRRSSRPQLQQRRSSKNDVLRATPPEKKGSSKNGNVGGNPSSSSPAKSFPSPVKSRRDVIRWKKVSGNFSNTFDQPPPQQSPSDDMRWQGTASGRPRPTSLYDNVETMSDLNSEDMHALNGLRTRGENDVFEMNFQAAVEEVGISTLPPPSPVVTASTLLHLHRKTTDSRSYLAGGGGGNNTRHHHHQQRLPQIHSSTSSTWNDTDLDQQVVISPTRKSLHRFPVPAHIPADEIYHLDPIAVVSSHNHNSNNSNHSRNYQTENPRRSKRQGGARKRHSGDYVRDLKNNHNNHSSTYHNNKAKSSSSNQQRPR